jgi:hypothetical protein
MMPFSPWRQVKEIEFGGWVDGYVNLILLGFTTFSSFAVPLNIVQ